MDEQCHGRDAISPIIDMRHADAIPIVEPSSAPLETELDVANVPSVFFVSLPKSGTVYTWYSLQDMTGLRMPEFHALEGWNAYNEGHDFSCPDLYACGDYNTQLLIPAGMKHYLRGTIFGAHMQASYHNVMVLQKSGIKKVTVLLRDPRDAFISWVYHLAKLGPTARNYHSKIYHIPRDYYDWPLKRQFDYQIRTFFPTTVNWIEGWLDYYAAADRALEVQFVYYDELKQDPKRYVQRIAEFHDLQNIEYTKVITAEPGKMHFRRGEHDQWRDEFSQENQRLVAELMQDRIIRGYEKAAELNPHLVAAQRHLDESEYRAAASEALSAIAEFPNFRPAYDALIAAIEACGVDVSRALLEDEPELSPNLSTAGVFRYPYSRIDRYHALAAAALNRPVE